MPGFTFKYKRRLDAVGLSVKEYGAKGDGVADDTAAIQAAIDAAAAAGVATAELENFDATARFVGGSTVYFPPGVYLNRGIWLGNRVALQGTKGSILWLANGANVPVIRNRPHSVLCAVRGLRVDGNKTNQSPVTVTTADASMTVGSRQVTSATASFTTAMIGSLTTVSAAGSLTGGVLTTHIADIIDSSNALLANNAVASVTGSTLTISPNAHGIAFTLATDGYDRTTDEDYDGSFVLDNVLIHSAFNDGLHSAGRADSYFHAVRSYYSRGHGFYFEQDIHAVLCNAGRSGLYGFYLRGGSIKCSACKAWMSGDLNVTDATYGDGFRLDTLKNVSLTACEAQDNARSGISAVACNGISVAGFLADSNGRYQTAPGFDVFTTTNSIISGSAIDNNRSGTDWKGVGGTKRQDSALMIRSTSTGNCIRLASVNNAKFAQTNPHVSTFSTSVVGNDLQINATGGGQQSVAYAASITADATGGQTVNVGTLTGNITVNAPNFPWQGQKLRFVFTQDVPGARTITFNAVFKTNWSPSTASGKINVIDFEYDGTNWNQTGATVGL